MNAVHLLADGPRLAQGFLQSPVLDGGDHLMASAIFRMFRVAPMRCLIERRSCMACSALPADEVGL
jgi:hypothetical protein